MVINNLKIAFRNFWKHRGYTFINIFGLAIGLACVFLVTLFIYDEMSYDRFHENANRIYRVTEYQEYERGVLYVSVTPGPLAEALETEYPEVEEAVRYRNINNPMFKVGDQNFRQRRADYRSD